MSTPKTVAIVGATGAVGRTMLQILQERNFPISNLLLFASERSAGKQVEFRGESITLQTIKPGCFKGVDIGLFSAGASISQTAAPQAASEGCVVVDNTSAFRYDPEIPLVVPEVNPEKIAEHNGIIANPNCSTIQMLVALKPLHDAARLTRLIVSTYQATSGGGWKATREMLEGTRADLAGEPYDYKVFAHPIAFNALPQIDVFLEDGWTKEEMKMVWETHKILGDENIGVTATCVRIPVKNGHSESVYAEFARPVEVQEAISLWEKMDGVQVADDVANKLYPLASTASGTDPVYVGRTRKDRVNPNALNFWCVSDNLRKGAALNAVQIAEKLL